MLYRNLAKPIKVGTLELKNRVVMTALTLMYADAGRMNERLKNFYFRRAEGGTAMVIAGGVATDNYVGYNGMMRLDDDRYISGMKELADGMHERGCLLALQFLQTGRYGKKNAVFGDDSTISASAVYSTYSRETPREMTKEEIRTAIERAAQAAVRAKQAGVDAVEICANSGYLISQFLSPVTNLRTDEYGGDFEHRCRFGLEMIRAMRAAVGPDYTLILRVAGNEYMPGGNGTNESAAFARMAEEAGVDMIDVTGGWHETVIPQLPAEVPRGGFVYLAESVKRAVSIPVLSSNRHNDPDEAERVIALGQADLIGECRTLVADPDWADKVISGCADEIRKCLACNQGCFANVFNEKPCKCLFNSYVGRDEKEKEILPAEKPKNILVIGAGPAGCEFAYRAASRGHSVTIWEKNDEIGGQAITASIPPSKYEFRNIPKFYSSMLIKYDVRMELGKEASADEIASAGFDEVVVAAGARPKRISIPGTEEIDVFTAEEILTGQYCAGRNVLVIGGGSVGCETADFLAREASINPEKLYFYVTQRAESPERIASLANTSARNITVIDLINIGANYDYGCAWPVRKDLTRLGVKLCPYSSLESVEGKTVNLLICNRKTKEKEPVSIPCDTIVLAVGYSPENALFDALEAKGITVHNIGDSQKPGKVMDAILAADLLAEKI